MFKHVQGKLSPRVWVVTLCVAVAVAFFAGTSFGKVQPARPDSGAVASTATGTVYVGGVEEAAPSDLAVEPSFTQFWELWKMLKERYYQQPVDEKKMLYGAMSGLASSLEDPYTVFFEPKSAQEFTQSLQGKFEGIGAEIGIKDDALQIIAPLPDTPAERAGLQPGDLILKIDGKESITMPVEKAVTLIRGQQGTTVTLLIGRYKTEKDKAGKEKKTPTSVEVKIVRDVIVVKSVRVKYLKDKIALIEVYHFNQDTGDLFNQVVEEIATKDIKGVILDLRNNPGGYLDRAIDMASDWTSDLVVLQERRQGKIVEEYRGRPRARFLEMPTVVLVNQGSASASEIVAGALQDYQKAKIVGMKTFGKGTVQDFSDLPDKSSVKITIAEWLTPAGRSIDKQGIEPDVVIDRTADDYNAQRDPQLDKALELLTGKSAAQAAPATTKGTKTGK